MRARTLLATRPPPVVAAVAHQAVAVVLRDFGDIEEALAEFGAALKAATRAATPPGRAMCGRPTGSPWSCRGGRDAAWRRSSGHPGDARPAAGRIRLRQASALMHLGDYRATLDAAQLAVVLLAGDAPLWQARAVAHRAAAHAGLGGFDRADRDYARAEELFAVAGQRLELAALRENGLSSPSPAATCHRPSPCSTRPRRSSRSSGSSSRGSP